VLTADPTPSLVNLSSIIQQERQQTNSKRSSSKDPLLREASVEAASMSPSKSSSCRRTTKVQLPSEWSEGRGEEEDGEEKNIRPTAAAQWNIKPVVLCCSTGERKEKRKMATSIPWSCLLSTQIVQQN
jgi:hypothetical protein